MARQGAKAWSACEQAHVAGRILFFFLLFFFFAFSFLQFV
jgi:hypothetical protein